MDSWLEFVGSYCLGDVCVCSSKKIGGFIGKYYIKIWLKYFSFEYIFYIYYIVDCFYICSILFGLVLILGIMWIGEKVICFISVK